MYVFGCRFIIIIIIIIKWAELLGSCIVSDLVSLIM
jgi:hypothetical protein